VAAPPVGQVTASDLKDPRVASPRRPRRRSVLIVAAFLALVATTNLTGCNFSGPTGLTGCRANNMADSATHYVHYRDVLEQTRDAFDVQRRYEIDPTAVDTRTMDIINENTDVIVRDGAYEKTTYCNIEWYVPGVRIGPVGLAQCERINAAKRCDRFSIRIMNLVMTQGSIALRRSVALHEMLHTLGLLHRDVPGEVMASRDSTATVISDHDREHLDAAYS
jgi:hypothetical protein